MGKYQGTSGAAPAAAGRLRRPRGPPYEIPVWVQGFNKPPLHCGLSVAHEAMIPLLVLLIIFLSGCLWALALLVPDQLLSAAEPQGLRAGLVHHITDTRRG